MRAALKGSTWYPFRVHSIVFVQCSTKGGSWCPWPVEMLAKKTGDMCKTVKEQLGYLEQKEKYVMQSSNETSLCLSLEGVIKTVLIPVVILETGSENWSTHKDMHTFITPELSTHILPWVISLIGLLTGNLSARLVCPRNPLIWCWLPEILPVNRPEVHVSVQTPLPGLMGGWKRKLSGRREDAKEGKERMRLVGRGWDEGVQSESSKTALGQIHFCSGQNV